ncbi:universal stress protein, partial [Kineococcus glutinatus]|uniref:universal stress protein n=1 Tax=Kineococcus glutinatus TaxID=1070872 RepID=UPI0031F06A15
MPTTEISTRPTTRAGRPDPRPVVVGVDGSPDSRHALALAAQEAGRGGSPLHVVAVAGRAHHHGDGVPCPRCGRG